VSFNGFPNGIGILDCLPGLTREEFSALHPEWEHQILDPLRLLVTDLGQRLQQEISPMLAAEPNVNGSISPINRDLRFARDQSSIYKDHLMLNFWEGPDKKSAPTLRVRIWNEGVGFAAGAAFSPDGLERWRAALDSDALAEFVDALAEAHRDSGASYSEPELKNPPQGFDDDHPAVELSRHKTIQLRRLQRVPDSITRPYFAEWAAEQFAPLAPIHRWLVANTG